MSLLSMSRLCMCPGACICLPWRFDIWPVVSITMVSFEARPEGGETN